MEWYILVLIILLVILIMIGIFLFFKHRARKKALEKKYGRVPSHIELYFKEYFDSIIDNWDLVKKDKVDRWVDDMDDRVETVSTDIEELKANKVEIDQELTAVEKRIETLAEKGR